MTGWDVASEVLIPLGEPLLSLPHTLDCGQAFRWRQRESGWWVGVVRGHAVRLRREGDLVRGQIYPPLAETEHSTLSTQHPSACSRHPVPGTQSPVAFLSSYLRLDVDLQALYRAFAGADPWIARAAATYPGLRVLSQEPQETLLSYVCSTANSVPRISRSVEQMSRRYGRHIAHLDGEDYHAFPTPAELAAAPGAELWNECGLGWRAANLQKVARELLALPEGWPEQLRPMPYAEAKARLMGLPGIGPKIADCVCLFALGKDEAVPVDTHIWAIARDLFDVRIPTRTLTPATYETVSRLFVERYGPFAGWAQEYLYLWRRASQGRVSSL